MDEFMDTHSGELMILAMSTLLVVTLWLLIPRLLRARQQALDLQHAEHMKALDKGCPLPRRDEASLAAGRTATLVPMVSICSAATVTCFMGAYKAENMFAVSLVSWAVAGVVSLAAITGGVALMGRLAQSNGAIEDEEVSQNPLE